MANLNNKNSVLENVFAYLESNGFNQREKSVTGKTFSKDDKLVVIYGDTVSFRECMINDEEIDYPEFAHCTGIEALDIKGWKLLLDAYHIVPIAFQLKINMNRQPNNQWIGDTIENYFSNVKTLMMLMLVACMFLFTSCKTERQTQLQNGKVVIENGHIYFDAVNDYKPIPKDTVLVGFRVRNRAVKKSK
jgi:hypothetical protein